MVKADPDVNILKMSGLLPYYVYEKDGKEYTKYGNEVYAIYDNYDEEGQEQRTPDIEGTYVSTGAVKSVDFDNDFAITDKQAISIIRASNANLADTDGLTCTVGVYYLETPAGENSSVTHVDLTITMAEDEYYVTTIFDINSIKTGVETTPGTIIIPYSDNVQPNPNAKWILMYDVDAVNESSEHKDALQVYDLVGTA